MSKNISTLERQIIRVKAELMELGEIRPGSLSEQYNVCGKRNCSLMFPRKNGQESLRCS